MQVKVSRLRLAPDNGTVKAYAEVTIGDAFAIRVRLIEGSKGLFVSFPAEKGQDGNYYEVAHPITAEARKAVQDAVLKAFEKAKAADKDR